MVFSDSFLFCCLNGVEKQRRVQRFQSMRVSSKHVSARKHGSSKVDTTLSRTSGSLSARSRRLGFMVTQFAVRVSAGRDVVEVVSLTD
jgi:hypothetical protein